MILYYQMKKVNFKDIFIICFISFFSSFVITLFFYLFPPKTLETHVPHGLNEVVERNYDGPLYVVVAKTFYNLKTLEKINFNNLPPIYFSSHFPLLPLLIKIITYLTGNYFRSLILIAWISSALFTVIFYLFLKKFKLTNQPLLLSLVSLFLPPRWLAVRTVGGTESLFMLILIICLYFWLSKKYFYSLFGSIFLVLSRPPGLWCFFSFLAVTFYDYLISKNKKQTLLKIIKERWALIFMPLTIVALFLFYQKCFGDFWVYFKTNSGTNIHFKNLPFAAVLGYNSPVAEGFLYLFGIYLVGIFILWKQNQKQLALFSLVYLIPNLFMQVDDIYRYLIPISPFCLIIGYQKLILHKAFKYFFLFFLIGIYIYTLSLLPRRMFHYWDYANLRLP